MERHNSLVDLLGASAARFPDNVAVNVPGGGQITYADLVRQSDRLRDLLVHLGVQKGDRVGFRLHKSIDSVISIFGILKAGAAYVPVDAESPASRGAFIFNDCGVKVVFLEKQSEAEMRAALEEHGCTAEVFSIDTEAGYGSSKLPELLDALDHSIGPDTSKTVDTGNDDLAYLLYTSGSTGLPKGVALTHGNALSFIDWCSEVFAPTDEDRFSSHAPFHFDLSILDIYLAIKHGAAIVLIGESLGKDPVQLAEVIAQERISIWYSTPSILSLLANYGKLDKQDHSSLRMVFFAGEVFPIPQFQALRQLWGEPRYFNLYGPTETNVCTWYEVPESETEVASMSSFPIGEICPPNIGRVVDETGRDVGSGEEGELIVAGPNVMQGYWNLDERTSKAFIKGEDGTAWYRTGDIVKLDDKGLYVYVGRRDRMVKRRGYRVELGEIEVALSKHADIREAAAIAVPDEESGVQVWTFVAPRGDAKLSIIALKGHASKQLPPYMIPDRFSVLESLPRTSTDKIDYQSLKTLCS